MQEKRHVSAMSAHLQADSREQARQPSGRQPWGVREAGAAAGPVYGIIEKIGGNSE